MKTNLKLALLHACQQSPATHFEKIYKTLCALVIMTALAACSSSNLKNNLDYSTEYDFSKPQYFKISHKATDFIFNTDVVEQRVSEILIQKGMKPLKQGKPDITFHYMIEPLGERSSMRLGLGTGTSTGNVGVGLGGSIPIGKKQVASVQLRVFDEASQKLVWKYSKEVSFKNDEQKKENLKAAFLEMLEQFPPKPEED